jgi:hypothetical protein
VRIRSIASIIGCALLAGCGGAKHTSSSVSSASSTPTGSTGSTATSSTAASPSTSSSATTTVSSTTTNAGGPHIRATFAIDAGEVLNPPMITVPASVTVQLTLTSADGRRHHVVVRTSPPHSLNVAPGGRSSITLAGLANGRYVILLDSGAGGGSLVVGGQPGP